jgi:hypothetical protein
MHTQLVATQKTLLPTQANPLLQGQAVKTVDVDELESETVFQRPRAKGKRELRDVRRAKTAAAAIAGLTKSNQLYGFTKGQFSLLDLIIACLEFTGPARLFVSTWTAARHEILKLQDLLEAGQIRDVRWLIDFTFARRDPEAANQIRQTFGLDSVRVSQNHAKFCLFENDQWRLVLRSSMNLNMNPRFEDFSLAHDPPLATFLTTIITEIWSKQRRSLQAESLSAQRRFFVEEL